MDLLVKPPALIPRPETEHWVNHLASLLTSEHHSAQAKALRILDIGTGTGCIPLALSAALPFPTTAMGIDISSAALDLAQANLARNPPRQGSTISFTHCDLFNPDEKLFEDRFDLVVSNPPYITPEEYETLPDSVKSWEDKRALVGEDNGLIFYKKITSLLPRILNPSSSGTAPCVAFEVGKGQAEVVEQMLRDHSYRVETLADQWGIGRCVLGYHR
jgi:HemK-like putative methylase